MITGTGDVHAVVVEDETASVREVVRMGERVLEVQFRELGEHRARTAEILRLAVASLAGLLAVAGLAVNAGYDADWFARSFFLSALAGMFYATVVLARLQGAQSTGDLFSAGPAPDALAAVLRDARPAAYDLLVSAAVAIGESTSLNERAIVRVSARRSAALGWLVASGFAFLLALSYIIGGGIAE